MVTINESNIELFLNCLGVVVAILSAFIALLIGWNLWNICGIERKIKKSIDKAIAEEQDRVTKSINDRSTQLRREMEEKVNDYNNALAACFSHTQANYAQKKDNAINHYCLALSYASKVKIYTDLFNIAGIISDFNLSITLCDPKESGVSLETVQSCLSMLSGLKFDGINEIISKLKKWETNLSEQAEQ